MKHAGYKNFRCVNGTNFDLQGEYYSSSFQYVKLSVEQCDSTKHKCKDASEVADFFTRNSFAMLYVDSYLDVDDLNDPVK